MSTWPAAATPINAKLADEIKARRLAGSGFEKMINEAVGAERERAIDRALEIVHWGDQYREGGNHPNSSYRRCGLCDRMRESMLDANYHPEAPFEAAWSEDGE